LRIFCTPQISQWRYAEHSKLVARARYHLRSAERVLVETPVAPDSIHDFTSVMLLKASGARALVIHARDDATVPFNAAEEIAGETPCTHLKACDGLGHGNILMAPQVAREAVRFLKPL
jgi:pimeloyl-ACP methyl ester carboxylesterase